jgi:pimeloyl-ACP methyl ester carboxylesterase/uncharacterized protein YciI
MRFVNYATYVEDRQKLADLQPEHAGYLASLLAEGTLAAAGSFADGSGELQVYETDSAEAARAVAAADPLAAGGALAGSELKPWDVVMAGDGLAPVQAGTRYLRADVDGVEVFYRDAGPRDAPVLVLLHGFPSSSRMFRDLIPRLSDAYRVIAPDYPGFGHSGVPDRAGFRYTFDHLAEVIDKLLGQLGVGQFALYVMDFGGPVGYRLALRHPGRLTAIIAQNAPLYPEEPRGWWATLGPYWADGSAEHREAARAYLDLDGLRGQYLYGVADPSRVDPDNWVIDKALIDRPGVDEIMLDLLYDIRNNVPTFQAMRQFIKDRKPPMLVATGANDEIFPEPVVRQILTDHPAAEYHALDAGHFALEDKAAEIAGLMRDFLRRRHVAH